MIDTVTCTSLQITLAKNVIFRNFIIFSNVQNSRSTDFENIPFKNNLNNKDILE